MLRTVLQRASSTAAQSRLVCTQLASLQEVAPACEQQLQQLPSAGWFSSRTSSHIGSSSSSASRRAFSSQPVQDADEEEDDLAFRCSERVKRIADEVVELNLLEVHDLTELLRKKLGITAPMGMPMMGMPMAGMMPGAAPAAGDGGAAAEAAPTAEEKTDFDIKLDGFDAAAKIKVIKEIRGITGLGLKESKELVEGAPAVVKKGVKKEEAEAIKATLEAAGAKVVLE